MLPSFLFFKENYLAGSFRFQEHDFFPGWLLALADQSPDLLLISLLMLMMIFWFGFLMGFKTQISAFALTLCAYFFYARNAFYLKTLAWDMLLVTLVPFCGFASHPLLLRRLLRLQFTFIYMYAALNKIIPGNWMRENPLHYLMHYPDQSVMRGEALKGLFSFRPELCYLLGILIVSFEFILPVLLWIPRWSRWGIAAGILFHLMLSLLFHVPLLFLLLFAAYGLLFGLSVPSCRR
ncbi:MAG: hypothetical protein HYZ85_01690 [Candidatus Omnitrophica bacterium]|nr:hypothetical protein [Candidatus Omnitrophota bacterium]